MSIWDSRVFLIIIKRVYFTHRFNLVLNAILTELDLAS